MIAHSDSLCNNGSFLLFSLPEQSMMPHQPLVPQNNITWQQQHIDGQCCNPKKQCSSMLCTAATPLLKE